MTIHSRLPMPLVQQTARAITFGTEGWRGIIAEEFTADRVRLVTQAIADHLRAQRPSATPRHSSLITHHSSRPTVAVGYDTRFLSGYFAKAVCEVLAGNGVRCVLGTQPVPTCAVSRAVVERRCAAGIVITASHNPGLYNGLKIKEPFGGSATTDTMASIERRVGRSPVVRLPYDQALGERTIRRVDLLPDFLAGIRASVDLAAIRRSPFRVVVDSMHGTGGRLIERLLRGGRCRVVTLHADPDPLFGGHAPEPIAAHLTALSAAVRSHRGTLGIANDGDADRLGLIGPDGAWLNPGQVLCVLLVHLVTARALSGAVVKSVSNTMMINRVAAAYGLPLLEVPVGFKHIAKLMLTQDVLIGGEESGGIGLKGYLPERDGLVNGLLVLEALATRRQTLTQIMRELTRRFGRWHYARRDLHLTMPQVEALFRHLRASPPERIAGVPVVAVNHLDGVKLLGRDESWLLFRRSGTEPVVRIYAEAPGWRHLPRLLAFGVRLAMAR